MVGHCDMLTPSVEIISALRIAPGIRGQYGPIGLAMKLITTHILRIARKRIMRNQIARRLVKYAHPECCTPYGTEPFLISNRHRDAVDSLTAGCCPTNAATRTREGTPRGSPAVRKLITVGINCFAADLYRFAGSRISATFPYRQHLRCHIDFSDNGKLQAGRI